MKLFRALNSTALSVVMMSAAGAAYAQSSDTAPATPGAPATAVNTSDEILVTGTRRSDRTVAQSVSPVDVFSSKDLATQSSSDMVNVLRNLIPSFNVSRFTGINSDGSAFIRNPTLRNLPADEILVLVNGKRRYRSALVAISGGGGLTSGAQGVDLAQIPAIAIDRIEVLRDGASAQYGSDAIAGVINYTLRHDNHGIELRARYGQYYAGDGQNVQLSGNVGLKLTDRGFLDIAVDGSRSLETSRGGQRPSAYATLQAIPSFVVADPVQKVGDPYSEAVHSFVNAGFDFDNNTHLYAYGSYGRTYSYAQYNWRNPYTVTGTAQNGTGTQTYARTALFAPIYLDKLANGTWDANGRTFSFTSVYPYGFTPYFRAHLTDYSGTGGYKGELPFGLTFDLTGSYGRSKVRYNIDHTVNSSLGPDSPTSFYAGTLIETDQTYNADFTYPLQVGFASPITIAFGGEHRNENYQIKQGDAASYAAGPYTVQVLSNGTTVTQATGASGFPGFSPTYETNSTRKSYSAYVDLETDIIEALSVGVAGRFEHYADFGNTVNYKVSARYAFNPVVAIRGGYSTGFRAPTVGQIYMTAGTTGFSGSQPIENLTLPPSSPAAQLYGAKDLKPEKSKNISAGLVITPNSKLTITADYYNIKVSNRIGLSGTFYITTAAQRAQLQAAGLPNWATLGTLRYFTNAFDTRTQGVDVVATYRLNTDFGLFNSTLSGNYNGTKVPWRNAAIIDDVRLGNIEHLNPRIRGNFTESWSLDRFSAMGRASYYGKWTSYDTVANGGNLKAGSEWTFDMELDYQLTKNISIGAGGENIFDNYPDKNIRSRGLSNSNWYETTQTKVDSSVYLDNAPFGYNGGFWYVRVGVKF